MIKNSSKHDYEIRFVKWITVKGRRIYARHYGRVAFPLKVR